MIHRWCHPIHCDLRTHQFRDEYSLGHRAVKYRPEVFRVVSMYAKADGLSLSIQCDGNTHLLAATSPRVRGHPASCRYNDTGIKMATAPGAGQGQTTVNIAQV